MNTTSTKLQRLHNVAIRQIIIFFMLKDHNHDLVQQLSEISDSLWRIESYKKASEGCATCSAMWAKFHKDYEDHTKMLADEIKKHVEENRFD